MAAISLMLLWITLLGAIVNDVTMILSAIDSPGIPSHYESLINKLLLLLWAVADCYYQSCNTPLILSTAVRSTGIS